MQSNLEPVTVDARVIEPKYRFDKIIGAWESLKIGQEMFLQVDHDPQCMYFTIKAEYGDDTFDFEYLKSGPIDWEVKVTKKK